MEKKGKFFALGELDMITTRYTTNFQLPDYQFCGILKGIKKGKFSLKIAKHYRIIYAFNKSIREVTVHQIGHRSNVY